MKEVYIRDLEYFTDPQAIEPGLTMVDYLGDRFELQESFYVYKLADTLERYLMEKLSQIVDIAERAKALGLAYFALAATLKLPDLINRCRAAPFVGNISLELRREMTEQSKRFGGSKLKGGLWELWYIAFDEVCRGFDEVIESGGSTEVAIWGDWVIADVAKVIDFERRFLEQFRVPSLPEGDTVGRAARATRWIELCALRGQALFALSSGLKDGRIKIGSK